MAPPSTYKPRGRLGQWLAVRLPIGRVIHDQFVVYRHALAGVDEDAIATRKQRLHRVAVDGDHAQVCGAGAELVPDHVLRKIPNLLHLLEVFMNGAGPGRGAHINFRYAAESFQGVARRRWVNHRRHFRARSRLARWHSAVAQLVFLAAQVFGEGSAHVLRQRLGGAAIDELMQVGRIPPDRERDVLQFAPALIHQWKAPLLPREGFCITAPAIELSDRAACGLSSGLCSGAGTMPCAELFAALRTHGHPARASSRPATAHLMRTSTTAEIAGDLRRIAIRKADKQECYRSRNPNE
jgi:hypothetical protein